MKQSIEALKGFDSVKVKHHNPLDENNNSVPTAYRATHVGLVKGGKVYVGIAKTAPEDQFNKTLGREIALGRAMQTWKVDAGIVPARLKKTGTISRGETSYVRTFATPEQLETILMTDIYDGLVEVKEVKPDVEPVEASGCCGGKVCQS